MCVMCCWHLTVCQRLEPLWHGPRGRLVGHEGPDSGSVLQERVLEGLGQVACLSDRQLQTSGHWPPRALPPRRGETKDTKKYTVFNPLPQIYNPWVILTELKPTPPTKLTQLLWKESVESVTGGKMKHKIMKTATNTCALRWLFRFWIIKIWWHDVTASTLLFSFFSIIFLPHIILILTDVTAHRFIKPLGNI